MNRALPAAAQDRPTRRLFPRPHLRRTHVSLIRTDTITVGVNEAANLIHNPAVDVRHARLVAPGTVRMVVRYPDRAAPVARQPLLRFSLDRRAIETITKVGAALGRAALWTFAVTAAATVTGGLIWHLFGDQLTAAAKILLAMVGGVAALIALVWLLSAKAGICPGLHCPGCPHH